MVGIETLKKHLKNKELTNEYVEELSIFFNLLANQLIESELNKHKNI